MIEAIRPHNVLRGAIFLAVAALAGSNSAAWGADFDSAQALTVEELAAGAKADGRLTFYTALPQFSNEQLLSAFMAKYPFIKAEAVRAGGPVIAQRFAAEKARKVENADVIFSGVAEAYPDWARSGYIARVDNLPEWGNLIDLAHAPSGQYVAFAFASHVMAWNRKVYKDADIPSDLWEFTKPEWKDKTATGDPAGAGFAFNWFSFASGVRPQDPRSKASAPGLGFKWMAAMGQNGLLLAGQLGNLTDALVSGRRPIVLQHWDTEIVEAIRQGADLGWKYPTQGTVAQHILGAVNKGAPHPYAARLYLDWLLSKEGQKMIIQQVAMNTVRKDMNTVDYLPGRKQIADCWVMDIEKIQPEETRQFIIQVSEALRGKPGN